MAFKVLFDFQDDALRGNREKAVAVGGGVGVGLIPASEDLIVSGKGIVSFTGPTGSGKGVIIPSGIIMFRNRNPEWVFLYLSIHDLPNQELRCCRMVFEASGEDVSCLKRPSDIHAPSDIEQGDVILIGFESISKKNNLLRQDSGQGDSLQSWISYIRDDLGCKVCVIVDEAHKHYERKTAINTLKVVDEIIRPDLEWRFSATPHLKDCRWQLMKPLGLTREIEIPVSEVRKEGIIRQNIRLNFNLSSIVPGQDNQGFFLDSALRWRDVLQDKWAQTSTPIIPLVVIAIPSRLTGQVEDVQLRSYLDMLEGHGYTEDSGDVFVYMSDRKTGDDINDIPPSVKVLVTKEALSVGWDMPRCQALLMDRQISYEGVAIQWFGRTLRQPNLHMEDDEDLNYGYLFTDRDPKVIIEAMEKFNKESGLSGPGEVLVTLKPNFDMAPFTLPGSFYTHLKIEAFKKDKFFDIWGQVASEDLGALKVGAGEGKRHEFGMNLCALYAARTEEVEVKKGTIEAFDAPSFEKMDGSPSMMMFDGMKVREVMDDFVISALSRAGYVIGGSRGSKEAVLEALDEWFRHMGITIDEAMMMIVANGNIRNCVERAISTYSSVWRSERRDHPDFDFQPAPIISISLTHDQVRDGRYKKCIYDRQPVSVWDREAKLEDYIDDNPHLLCWMKNEQSKKGGDGSKDSLGVVYTTDDGDHLMYPDYILISNSMTPFLVEVKGGDSSLTTHENESKLRGLRNYQKKLARPYHSLLPSIHEGSSRRIVAGIAFLMDGTWLLNPGDKKNLRSPDPNDREGSGWHILDDLLSR